MQHDHGQHGGCLGNVGQGDHRPQHGAAELLGQRGVDGVGHVVQAGDDQRGVQQAEDGRKDPAQAAGQAGVDHVGDGVADAPADGADDGVRHNDRDDQREEGHNDHRDVFRGDLFEEPLHIDQHKGGQHGGDDLRLVADHLDLGKAEVPHRDVRRGGGGHRVGVEQLGRDQADAQDDAQNLGAAHLFDHRPADGHRQEVEHRLADQPQKVIHAGPELGGIRQREGAVLKQVDVADKAAETQNQAADDQGGDQRGKDLGQVGHGPLQGILVGFGRLLGGVLADALNAGDLGELVVELGHFVADDDLELPRLGKAALGAGQRLDGFYVGLGRVRQHKAHAGDAVGHGVDVFFSADQLEQLFSIRCKFSHDTRSLQTCTCFWKLVRYLIRICFRCICMVSYTYMFVQRETETLVKRTKKRRLFCANRRRKEGEKCR